MKRIVRLLIVASLLMLTVVLASCMADQDDFSPKNPAFFWDDATLQDSQESNALLMDTTTAVFDTTTAVYVVQPDPIIINYLPRYQIDNEILHPILDQTIGNDGREIIVNSGCGWFFTLPEDSSQINVLKDMIRALLGIDIDQIIDKRINVKTFDAGLAGSNNLWNNKITYLYVFSGDSLVYQSKLENSDQFRAVVNLCAQLEGRATIDYDTMHQLLINYTIGNDGREIITNSACVWSFTLLENSSQQNALKDRIRALLGIDVDQIIDKRITVKTYDAAPAGSVDLWSEVVTYLYIFSGYNLVYQEKLASIEQFRAVVNLCEQLEGRAIIDNELIQQALTQAIAKDGREIIVNSGCSWSFTLRENSSHQSALKDKISAVLNIGIGQVFDKRIRVITYDASPVGSVNWWNDKTTYLFVFSGNDLVYQDKLEGFTQFRAVVDLCEQLSGGSIA